MSPLSLEENAAVIATIERLARFGRRMLALRCSQLTYRDRAIIDDTPLPIDVSGVIGNAKAGESVESAQLCSNKDL